MSQVYVAVYDVRNGWTDWLPFTPSPVLGGADGIVSFPSVTATTVTHFAVACDGRVNVHPLNATVAVGKRDSFALDVHLSVPGVSR